MASFFYKPILAVVYMSSIFLRVSSIDVIEAAAPTTQDVNDPLPTCTDPCPCPVAGPPGAAGIPGLHGTHGQPGAQGPAGDSGAKGNRGFHGYDGTDGDAGPKGDDGIDGTNGASGLKGDKGDQGNTGNQGSKGDPGTPYTPPPTVAFVAHLTTAFRLSSGDKIIDFQTMKLNIGDDFSLTSGVFTCRIPGLYYFTFNLLPYGTGTYVSVNLEHHGVAMGRVYIYGAANDYGAYASSSHSTILALDKGDEVLLRGYSPTDIYGASDGRSTFSGYLLQETTSAFITNLNTE